MINESNLRKKFPSKNPGKNIAAKKKAIQMEYRRKRAELGIGPPQLKRGFPYYMVIILGMVLVGGLVGSAIFERGGVDLSGKKNEKAIASLENLAVALGRYRYHTGVYPSTEEGLEQLSKTRLRVPGWLGPYIKEIKPDPWGNHYVYMNDGEGKDPVLYSCGPDGRSGTTDDILVERSFFDVPFKDVSWTEGWVPWHLRDIMWVENEREKELAERRVSAALGQVSVSDGRMSLDGEWFFESGPTNGFARPVSLPLDWRPYASAYYSKDGEVSLQRASFRVDADLEGAYGALRFAAVSGRIEAELNGIGLDIADVGRDGYEADITRAVRYGDINTLKIKIFAGPDRKSAGVTGNAWIEFSDPGERTVTGSLKVNVLKATEAVSEIRVDRLVSRFDGTNTVVKAESRDYTIDRPKLWTFDNPVTRIGNLTGRYVIRTVETSTGESVVFNGRETRIKGVVSDSSLGILGEAFSARQAEIKFTALKESGVNAVYFADPKTNKAFFDLCDAIGLLAFGPGDIARLRLDTSKFIPANGLLGEADTAFIRASYMPGSKTLHVGPHWNWDKSGKARIECVTDADSVEFFVNGESAGEARKVSKFRFAKEIPYEAGELKAIAKKNGVYYTDAVLRTAYEPEALRFYMYPWELKEGESVILEVALTDDLGRVVPGGDGEIEFVIEDGPGVFVACGNAGGERGEIDVAGGRRAVCRLCNGKAFVAVRRGPFSRIPLRVAAKAPGLRPAYAFLPYQFR